MDLFNKISNTLKTAGQDSITKAKEIKNTTKLTLEIKEAEGKITQLYKELGHRYYELHKDNDNADFPQIQEISDLFTTIEELKAERIKAKGNSICPSCEAEVKEDDVFCPQCGKKVPRENMENPVNEDSPEETPIDVTAVVEDIPKED